jgi:hypothetical protein
MGASEGQDFDPGAAGNKALMPPVRVDAVGSAAQPAPGSTPSTGHRRSLGGRPKRGAQRWVREVPGVVLRHIEACLDSRRHSDRLVFTLFGIAAYCSLRSFQGFCLRRRRGRGVAARDSAPACAPLGDEPTIGAEDAQRTLTELIRPVVTGLHRPSSVARLAGLSCSPVWRLVTGRGRVEPRTVVEVVAAFGTPPGDGRELIGLALLCDKRLSPRARAYLSKVLCRPITAGGGTQ